MNKKLATTIVAVGLVTGGIALQLDKTTTLETTYTLKQADARFDADTKFYKMNERLYAPDPLKVHGVQHQYLWQDRLAEIQKTNPNATLKDLDWSIADIPDEDLVPAEAIQ